MNFLFLTILMPLLCRPGFAVPYRSRVVRSNPFFSDTDYPAHPIDVGATSVSHGANPFMASMPYSNKYGQLPAGTVINNPLTLRGGFGLDLVDNRVGIIGKFSTDTDDPNLPVFHLDGDIDVGDEPVGVGIAGQVHGVNNFPKQWSDHDATKYMENVLLANSGSGGEASSQARPHYYVPPTHQQSSFSQPQRNANSGQFSNWSSSGGNWQPLGDDNGSNFVPVAGKSRNVPQNAIWANQFQRLEAAHLRRQGIAQENPGTQRQMPAIYRNPLVV